MQHILIIFPDPHLPYSPTILNLYEALKKHFNVTILNFENRQFKPIDNPDVFYIRIPFFEKKIHGIVNRFSKSYGQVLMAYIKKHLIKSYLKRKTYHQYIVTDLIGLWMVNGLVQQPIHLVSLELTFNTSFFKDKVDINKLSSILIQSKERLEYIAPAFSKPVFFLQNAPVFHPDLMQEKSAPIKNHLIFSGTASSQFGIVQCLEFLRLNHEYKMTLIGNVPETERTIIHSEYARLIDEGRLIIEPKYFSTKEMLLEVSKYWIGFCFYDFSFPEIDNINYRTAPTGKMFTYFATGVPVIGINIPGLKPVSDFKAGVLIDDLSPESILQAVKNIEADYEQMVQGCFRAAEYFSFDTRVKPFVEFVKQGGL